ncbi:inovirus Gp2 family protein [Moellerella wisconsensis]|uniref:Inovirus Gp2 family protein n=1 Tax=Moellerella wisconsensis TaxID=158849 RepID=A0A9Q8Q283_9GAMM|nr:inovirus Gp2 family protein [Moellerella wisconsensis]UNH30836.1 inovirus Gp2 family protein [Moellerella wisconsensis]
MKIFINKRNNKESSINKKIIEMIDKKLKATIDKHKRLFIVRIDLRFPKNIECKKNSRVISRFFDSLKEKLSAHEKRKKKEEKRIYPHGLEYIWVRERGPKNHQLHYHCILLFNKDAFFTLGNFNSVGCNLYTMINTAWHSAISKDCITDGLVHASGFEKKYLCKTHESFNEDYDKWLKYLSYLAKDFSKPYKDGNRVVGCSR